MYTSSSSSQDNEPKEWELIMRHEVPRFDSKAAFLETQASQLENLATFIQSHIQRRLANLQRQPHQSKCFRHTPSSFSIPSSLALAPLGSTKVVDVIINGSSSESFSSELFENHVALLKNKIQTLKHYWVNEKLEREEHIKILTRDIHNLRTGHEAVIAQIIETEQKGQKSDDDVNVKMRTFEELRNLVDEKESKIRVLRESLDEKDRKISGLRRTNQDLHKLLREKVQEKGTEKGFKDKFHEKDGEIQILKQKLIERKNALKEFADQNKSEIENLKLRVRELGTCQK